MANLVTGEQRMKISVVTEHRRILKEHFNIRTQQFSSLTEKLNEITINYAVTVL